jgi:hypothetical protein
MTATSKLARVNGFKVYSDGNRVHVFHGSGLFYLNGCGDSSELVSGTDKRGVIKVGVGRGCKPTGFKQLYDFSVAQSYGDNGIRIVFHGSPLQ